MPNPNNLNPTKKDLVTALLFWGFNLTPEGTYQRMGEEISMKNNVWIKYVDGELISTIPMEMLWIDVYGNIRPKKGWRK